MNVVTIEIGHTYAHDRLIRLAAANETGDFYSPEIGRAFNETAEAARLRKIAEYFGEPAIRVALVDDVAVKEAQKKSAEDAWRWQHFLNAGFASVKLGTGVEWSGLFRESDFEQDGRAMVAQIQDMELPGGYRLSQDGRKLITGSGRDRLAVPLLGFKDVDDVTFPSCQVLDTAWLQKRLTIAPEAITVLPASYEQQQRGANVLAGLMGIDSSSYTTVFYNPVD